MQAPEGGILEPVFPRSSSLVIAMLQTGGVTPVQTTFEPPLNVPSTSDDLATEHRRNHRPGTPAKINCDPDLQAFILARIETQTFDQVIAEIAAYFPPTRRIKRSALHRWWRNREAMAEHRSANHL